MGLVNLVGLALHVGRKGAHSYPSACLGPACHQETLATQTVLRFRSLTPRKFKKLPSSPWPLATQAPELLVGDVALNELAMRRPGCREDLHLISGLGAAALAQYGPALLEVVTSFCASSKHLATCAGWVKRSG